MHVSFSIRENAYYAYKELKQRANNIEFVKCSHDGMKLPPK